MDNNREVLTEREVRERQAYFQCTWCGGGHLAADCALRLQNLDSVAKACKTTGKLVADYTLKTA